MKLLDELYIFSYAGLRRIGPDTRAYDGAPFAVAVLLGNIFGGLMVLSVLVHTFSLPTFGKWVLAGVGFATFGTLEYYFKGTGHAHFLLERGESRIEAHRTQWFGFWLVFGSLLFPLVCLGFVVVVI